MSQTLNIRVKAMVESHKTRVRSGATWPVELDKE